jgi:hypothetical protein
MMFPDPAATKVVAYSSPPISCVAEPVSRTPPFECDRPFTTFEIPVTLIASAFPEEAHSTERDTAGTVVGIGFVVVDAGLVVGVVVVDVVVGLVVGVVVEVDVVVDGSMVVVEVVVVVEEVAGTVVGSMGAGVTV